MPLSQPQIADRLAPHTKNEGQSAKEHSYFGCFILLLGILLIFDGLFLLVPIFFIIYLRTTSMRQLTKKQCNLLHTQFTVWVVLIINDHTVVVRNKKKIKAMSLYFKLCRSGKLKRLSGAFTSISFLTIIVHLLLGPHQWDN
jgi:hypothetical protein